MSNIEAIKKYAESIGLKQNNAFLERDCGGSLCYKIGIQPSQFLTLAENSLGLDEANLINAVSNAQRAVRSQIKFALGALGFEAKGKKIKEQIALLNDMGILAPRLLRKISAPRNLMEHQYRKPSKDEAEDAVDIAALFLESTGRLIDTFWGRYVIKKKIGKRYVNAISVDFVEDVKVYRLHFHRSKKIESYLELDSSDSLFVPLHRIAVSLSREMPGYQSQVVTDTFFNFLDLVQIQ